MMRNTHSNLPPGFRFHPTDEELIFHYLSKKVESTPLPVSIIAEVDIYKFDPWDLPGKALFGEKEWYFFSPRDRKYPNGARPNRAAASGYWKATGTDKTIKASFAGDGVKKALVFYKGRPPKGIKTNWIMHEYRLVDSNQPIQLKWSSMRLDDWVLCRIYKKTKYDLPSTPEETTPAAVADHQQLHQQFVHNDPTLLPDLKPSTAENTLVSQKSFSLTNLLDAMDYSLLSSFLSENSTHPTEAGPTPELNGRHMQKQPFLGNSHDGYLYQKLPQLNSATPRNMENRLKRQNSDMVDQDTSYPSKKHVNSCSTTTLFDHSYQNGIPQCNTVNQQSPWFADQKDFTVEHDTKRLDNRFGFRRWN